MGSTSARRPRRGRLAYWFAYRASSGLVKPAAAERADLCQRYGELLHAAAAVLPFDAAAAEAYARIRCDRAIRPPDAIQLACAAAAGTDLFITDDDRLTRKTVRGIGVITSLAHAPL